MKKLMLSTLAIALATTYIMAGGNPNPPVKKAKAKQATCTSCPDGKKCTKATCDKPDCCK